MPFLSVVTRCYKRLNMLGKNISALNSQDDPDYEQLFLVDDVGYGVGYANRQLATAEPKGEYVLILDDDDMLINDQAITLLKEATLDKPDIVIFKADHDNLGILPSAAVWEKRPIYGQIGSCDFITRRDIWEKHIHAFGVDSAGDYAFLKAIWHDKPEVVWLNEVLAGVQRISWGAPA